MPDTPHVNITDNVHSQLGKLRMVITYLEMKKPPSYQRKTPRAENLSIIRSYKPTVHFYRYLYKTVGTPWLWYERNVISDDALEKIINRSSVQIYVLYVNGTPAGYSELEQQENNDVEIAYFGLIPEFLGRGLGTYFLRWTIQKAWSTKPNRVYVHTCNFDSPHALSTYQKAGFTPYRRELRIIDDPRVTSVES